MPEHPRTAVVRAWRKRRAYGRQAPTDRVPAAPLAALILDTKAATGLSYLQLARAIGWQERHLWDIVKRTERPGAYVWRATDERLRAALAAVPRPDPVRETAAPLPPAGWVSAERPRRQVRSMMALGWSGTWIATELGYVNQTGVPWLYRADRLTAPVAARVDALARRVGDRRGPSHRTARHAARMGWHVPGAYNDATGELIPGAALAVADTPAARRQLRDARRARVGELHAEGMTIRQSAERLMAEQLVAPTIKLGACERLVTRDREWIEQHTIEHREAS